jgi:hypothetical protein
MRRLRSSSADGPVDRPGHTDFTNLGLRMAALAAADPAPGHRAYGFGGLRHLNDGNLWFA